MENNWGGKVKKKIRILLQKNKPYSNSLALTIYYIQISNICAIKNEHLKTEWNKQHFPGATDISDLEKSSHLSSE